MSKTSLRIGYGFDIHRFSDERKLILGGVEIPSQRGLDGHSDADVLTHALIDAILGAAGLPDIGQRYPNTDKRWKDARSVELLKDVWDELTKDHWEFVNADISVVAEHPKLAPHITSMKEVLAAVLKTEVVNIGIKATTAEKIGSIGAGDGMCAMAVVLLSKEKC